MFETRAAVENNAAHRTLEVNLIEIVIKHYLLFKLNFKQSLSSQKCERFLVLLHRNWIFCRNCKQHQIQSILLNKIMMVILVI